MGYRVLLNLGQGSWETGFPTVLMKLQKSDGSAASQVTGSLPAAEGLGLLHQRWQDYYLALQKHLTLRRGLTKSGAEQGRSESGIFIDEEDTLTQISPREFEELGQTLKKQINLWLSVTSFIEIDRHLRMRLNIDDEIRIIVEANDPMVRRLPWNLWDLFDAYPAAEVGLSALDYLPPPVQVKVSRKQIRVLAVFGEAQGLDFQAEEQQLKLIPSAEVVMLVSPSRAELTEQLWAESGWDILFFAGHSITETAPNADDSETGSIAISATESITVSQLKNALNEAVSRGLKLAIFNSCEGLGIARDLSQVSIPHTIVMREPIANQVAQAFLLNFLQAFSQGTSLYLAVRKARRRLEGLQNTFPAASWLPVICQNPSVSERLTWASLQQSFADDNKTQRWKQLGKMLALSAVAAGLVIGVREAGWLQAVELKAYDHLMRSRPLESSDRRLLLVTVTEKDVQTQTDREMSLSNQSLEQLLQKLEPSNPRLIGLDIFRTVSAEGQYPKLFEALKHNDKLVSVCDIGEGTDADPGIGPSADITAHIPLGQTEARRVQLASRVGFSDSLMDADGTARRHLYGTLPSLDSPCQANNAFNLLLALRYLALEGIEPELLEDERLKVGRVTLPLLAPNTGSYQGINDSGYQMMTNYRSLETLADIADSYTLSEVLSGEPLPEDLSDRIVLVGTTAQSYKDYKPTPYALNTPGVIIQAHHISQLLSTVLDGRPLIRSWPQWAENMWIVMWAAAGGVALWCFNRPRVAVLVWVVGSGVVYAICYGLMVNAVWVPLFPPVLALLLACSCLSIFTFVK